MITMFAIKRSYLFLNCLFPVVFLCGQQNAISLPAGVPFPSAEKPLVVWYWQPGAVSKAGITADLEAMQQTGIGGAYLMPLKDTAVGSPSQAAIQQLTPAWWNMVNFAIQEAKRLRLQLTIHVSNDFILPDGPWIYPEQSMQQLVWTKTCVSGGTNNAQQLEQPETVAGYYKDIAVFAYPANSTQLFSDTVQVPTVSTSTGAKANFLCFDITSKEIFTAGTNCWIQYRYPRLFNCRSIRIHTPAGATQGLRLMVQAGNDGIHFSDIAGIELPRYAGPAAAENYTSSIPATNARYFRFVYKIDTAAPATEEGMADARPRAALQINTIYLSDEPVINQYEAKNGSRWSRELAVENDQAAYNAAVPLKNIINLTGKMDSTGKLLWAVPAGDWIIIRMGHTSIGSGNKKPGVATGLACDKFNPAAIEWQFKNWCNKAFENTDKRLAKQVLKIFQLDTWECGIQNWSRLFPGEFKKRRGYSLLPYLPVMAGVPIESSSVSEKILQDVRKTITELIQEKFYATVKKLARTKGCRFSAVSVENMQAGNGQRQHQYTGMPAGEFWLNGSNHTSIN